MDGTVGTHRVKGQGRFLPSRTVARVALAGAAIASTAAGIVAAGPAVQSGAQGSAPMSPVLVSAAQYGVAQDVKVFWTPSSAGVPATGAIVQVYQVLNLMGAGPKYLGQLSCKASCTSVIFRELGFGTFYEFAVFPTNAYGTGAPGASLPVAPMTSCAVGACVTLDATHAVGPVTHGESGIVHSLFPLGNDGADLAALHSSMWRGSPAYNAGGSLNWTSWNVAVQAGAQTTLVLSDLWRAYNGGQAATPWSNWSAYASWVNSTVTTIVNSGEQVNYWEVYNEPGGAGYYSPANQATVTTALLLQQFLVTYNAIKAVAPSAAVIGPSLAQWEDYAGRYTTTGNVDVSPDMVTFLNFAVANNIQLAAISWHEIVDNFGPNPDENTLLPATLEDHVAEARALLAARPSLGNPQIFINEFGMGEVQLIPGWDVAYLSALTAAGVNSADRSCWGSACSTPALDGLLGTDGVTPWNDYFVRQFYAAMNGTMIANSSTSDFVTALGSFNTSTNTLVGLVGRAVSCVAETWCTQTWPGETEAPPTAVNITVAVPWSSGTGYITLTNVPGQTVGPTTLPQGTSFTEPVTPNGSGQGTVTFQIPSFLDGDAYGFTVTNHTS